MRIGPFMLGFRTMCQGVVGPWWRQRWYGLAFGSMFVGLQTAERLEELQ
jgi:hypothetical protein